MQRHERQAVIGALAALDAMMLLWSVAFALIPMRSGPETVRGLILLLGGAGLGLTLMAAAGLYRVDDLFGGHREYAGVVRGCTVSAFAVLLVAFLLDLELARGSLILLWGGSVVLAGVGRFVFRRGINLLRRSGRFVRRALIAGTDEHAVALAERLASPGSGWQVLGFLDDYRPVGATVTDGLAVLGDPSAALEVAERVGAGDVILVPHAVSWEAQRDLLELAAVSDRISLQLAPGFYHLLAAGARPLEANYLPLLSLERLRITGVDRALKTALDYSVSLLALPAVGVLLGLLWIAARLSGGGPVLERRRALGLHSRPFDLLLLAPPPDRTPASGVSVRAWRTRRAAAEGRLRKLPILLNVLAGQMSLVGPRALAADAARPPHPATPTLLLVRPGLTGPGRPEGAGWSPQEQALPDVAYVRNYSLWLDLRLLFQSLLRVLRREQALPASYQPALSDQLLPEESATG